MFLNIQAYFKFTVRKFYISEDRYHVSTKAINIDFTGGPEIYKEIEEILKDLQGQGDIGVLGKIFSYFSLKIWIMHFEILLS